MGNYSYQLALLFFMTCVVVSAQSRVHNLNDLRNMRASSAEIELERMGYELSSVDKTTTGIYQYWYNDRYNECIQSTIYDGRVVAVRTVSGDKCREGNSSSARGLDLWSYNGMREAEASSSLQRRGYRVVESDGKGRGMVDLYWYNERDRQCLKMEVNGDYVRKVTKTSTSYCSDSGSKRYNDANDRNSTSMDYLKGWPATKAYDRLEDRGYTQKKGHRDDGKTWRVWYNSRTGECIKTLSENSKISKVIPSSRCD